MPRPVLDEDHIHPSVRQKVAAVAPIVAEVQAAIAQHAVVIVGMAQNPHPGQARRMLDAAGIAHHDLSYGSYFGGWRDRTKLKMWCGWPTLPMVFVRGTLVGGASDLERLIQSGELKRMLA
ncbi:MAG: glutaredoxin [Rhodoferax sp.]|nr:glutaredoxin [Rhodoferax sp.]